MTFKILSLDGGGIRGVLSARILKEIEDILKEEKGQKLHEYFDLIAGTSTGSILAAGIACQITSDKLIQLYQKEGKDIFLKSVRRQRSWRWLGRLIGSYALYPHERGEQGLAQVLKRNLVYQDSKKCPTIGEIKPIHLLILAYDVFSRNTTWFTNDYYSKKKPWYDEIEIWKICTASASAPTYFPPYKLLYSKGKEKEKEKDQYLPHIDGGVSANSPELAAIAHAFQINKDKSKFSKDKSKFSIDDIAILSLGTGKTTHPYKYEKIKKWGLLGWVQNISNIFLDPSSEISVAIAKQIIESRHPKNYLRLNFDLNQQFKGERKEGRLREELGTPYNEYIKEDIKKEIKLSEEIDNPEICDDLIQAAESYLKWGTITYNSQEDNSQEKIPVRDAIKKFIKQNN